jgi:hypothetical protein
MRAILIAYNEIHYVNIIRIPEITSEVIALDFYQKWLTYKALFSFKIVHLNNYFTSVSVPFRY